MGKTKKRPVRPEKQRFTKKRKNEMSEFVKCPECKKNTLKQKLEFRTNYPFGRNSKQRVSIKRKIVYCTNTIKKICGYSNEFRAKDYSQSEIISIR